MNRTVRVPLRIISPRKINFVLSFCLFFLRENNKRRNNTKKNYYSKTDLFFFHDFNDFISELSITIVQIKKLFASRLLIKCTILNVRCAISFNRTFIIYFLALLFLVFLFCDQHLFFIASSLRLPAGRQVGSTLVQKLFYQLWSDSCN